MKEHWKKHADEGFFTCEFCAEIFTSNEQFRVHMATHDAIEQEKVNITVHIQRKLQIRDSEIRDKVPYLNRNRKMANKGLFKSPLFVSEFG